MQLAQSSSENDKNTGNQKMSETVVCEEQVSGGHEMNTPPPRFSSIDDDGAGFE